jgi:hypothetical protein
LSIGSGYFSRSNEIFPIAKTCIKANALEHVLIGKPNYFSNKNMLDGVVAMNFFSSILLKAFEFRTSVFRMSSASTLPHGRACAGSLVALVSAGFLLASAGTALSEDKPAGGPTPSPPGASVYFVDVKNGAMIGTKTTIHFGLRGMGVAPAGSDKANSGHHHLLIDTELPPLDEAIPNDFNHLHFGGGQTEADVTLSPGPHTLQLLLGDKNHVPHSPPVMSEVIHVTVVDPEKANSAQTSQRHPSPAGAKVYFEYPTDGAYITPTPTIKFGLLNMGVAPAGFEKANTGHHHLIIDSPLPPFDQPIPNDPNHLHFGSGQTEAKISLTPGPHTLQLLLGDNAHIPHDPPVYSKPIKVIVNASGRRPRINRHHYRSYRHYLYH